MTKIKFYLQKFACACILLLVCVLFTGCPAYEVKSLIVDTSTIPQNVACEDLVLEDIKFTVNYRDGQVLTEFVSPYMLSDEDILKLNTIGTHTITINYMQATTTFVITLTNGNNETVIIDTRTSTDLEDLDYTVDTSTHNPDYIYFEPELAEALYFNNYKIKSQVEGDYAYTVADLSNYRGTILSHERGNIKNLSGLEYLPTLEKVYLTNNDICDITPISYLKNLNHLYIAGNHIKSLIALTNLTKLTYLDVSNNEINISPYSRTIDSTEMQYLEEIKVNNPGLKERLGKYEIYYTTQQTYFDASRITDNTPKWELVMVSFYNTECTITNPDNTQTHFKYSADETDKELMKETLRTFEIMAEIASNYQINIVITNIIYKDTMTLTPSYTGSENYNINIRKIPNMYIDLNKYDSYGIIAFHCDSPINSVGNCTTNVIKTEIYIPFGKNYKTYTEEKTTQLKLAKDNKLIFTVSVLCHEFAHALEQYWLTRKEQTNDQNIVVPGWHYVSNGTHFIEIPTNQSTTITPFALMKYFRAEFLDPDTQTYQGITSAMWQETPLDYLFPLA